MENGMKQTVIPHGAVLRVFCLDDRMGDDADELFVLWDGEENPERFTFSEYQFDKDGKSALIFIDDETLPMNKPRRLGSTQSGQKARVA